MAAERIQGWRCIGCGRVDAPQPCVGVCQDRKYEMVSAVDYDALHARTQALEAVLALVAHITPRAGEWEASWVAFQERARQVLK